MYCQYTFLLFTECIFLSMVGLSRKSWRAGWLTSSKCSIILSSFPCISKMSSVGIGILIDLPVFYCDAFGTCMQVSQRQEIFPAYARRYHLSDSREETQIKTREMLYFRRYSSIFLAVSTARFLIHLSHNQIHTAYCNSVVMSNSQQLSFEDMYIIVI